MKLTSAYNFVPTGRYIYYPEWEKYASYDYPMKNGTDGIIEVRITNVSPLFIRNGSNECNASELYSYHIQEKDRKIRYFIPGSSLRGLLRSTVESLSFSQMKQFSDIIVSYRDFVNEEGNDTDFIINARKSRPGWLKYIDGKWKLYPCKGKYLRINIEELNRFCENGDINEKDSLDKPKWELSWERNNYVFEKTKQMYPLYKKNKKTYRIVCTGIKRAKNHTDIESYKLKKKEYLFPTEKGDEIELENEFINYFFKLHGQERDFRKYKKMLYDGDEVAVFYQTDDNSKVNIMGMSRINKIGRKYTPKELLNNYIVNLNNNRYDLASLLFGYGGRAGQRLRGKVQVGNAFCTTLEFPSKSVPKNDILPIPRPTYNPLYIMQSSDQQRYNTYDDDDAILAGRKQYRIHDGNNVLERVNQNKTMEDESIRETKFFPYIPIKPNHMFECKIAIHNMCPVEIGALLSAITLLGDKEAYHNIGLAKSLGYGKIKTEIVSINLSGKNYKRYLQELIKYYMKEDEKAMSLFTYSYIDLYNSHGNKPLMWAETPTVKKFLGIKHCHSIEEVTQMTRSTYRLIRKDANFQVLTEPKISNISLLSHIDKEEIIHRTTLASILMPYLAKHLSPYLEQNLSPQSCLKNLRYSVLSGLYHYKRNQVFPFYPY